MDMPALDELLELKQQLSGGKYQTLIDILLDSIGRIFSKKKAVPFWITAVLICLVILVVGFGLSAILGEDQAFGTKIILIQILGVALAYVSLIIFKIYTRVLIRRFSENVIDAMTSQTGLNAVRRWLNSYCNIRLHAVFCLIYGLALGIFSAQSLFDANQIPDSYGLTTLSCLVAFVWGIPMYWLFMFLALPIQLGRQEYHLFKGDPASSGIVTHLSGLFVELVYLYGVVAMGSIAYLAFADILPDIWGISILVAWLPIILLFLAGQWALRTIVLRGKQRSLSDIQRQIERIQGEADMSEKDTMDRISRLLDYHDRVKSSKNENVNLRSGLDFLNSLLLPVIGTIFGDVGKFIEGIYKVFPALRDIFN